MKPLNCFLALALGLGLAAPAQAQPITAISLPSGRSTTIDAPGLTRVAVGDVKIAGVVPVGTQQVIVDAKAPGHTTILVWDREGRHDYDVTVTEQTLDDLSQMLRTAIDTAGVGVEPIGKAIVVTGTVGDQAHANAISAIVGRFGVLAKNLGYSIVDAVLVTNPLGDLQAALGRSADAHNVRVDYDDHGNVIVSGSVRDDAARAAVVQQVRSLAGPMLSATGKVEDRLITEVNEQVDTHVYILEVDKTAQQQLGIRLQSATLQNGTVVYGNPSFPAYENPGAVGTPGRGLTIGSFIRSTFLAPTLDLLLQHGDARILSSPNLLATPGSAAQFLVGGQIPYIVSSGLGQVSVAWQNYGVQLKVTPTILPDGSIETKVNPTVSDLDFSNGITFAGYTEPALTTSTIDTDVISKPGESIVMAGLLRHQEIRNITKIPGLSSIPILGKLFQSTSYQKNDTDVVFVMTPEVITR